jgi:hypothetical protein
MQSWITPAVTAGLALLPPVISLVEVTGKRSLLARVDAETARGKEVNDLLAALKGTNSSETLRSQLQREQESIAFRLRMLNRHVARHQRDPNYDLPFWRNLFLWFPQDTELAAKLRALAYLCPVAGVSAIMLLVSLANWKSGQERLHVCTDVALLAIFCTIAFRAWALFSRRWAHPHRPSPIAALNQPVNWQMFLAQFCLWSCLFSAIESLEDVVGNIGEPKIDLARFLLSLWGTSACLAWAKAEYRRRDGRSRGQRRNYFRQIPLWPVAFVSAIALGFTSAGKLDWVELAFASVALVVAGGRLWQLRAASMQRGTALTGRAMAASAGSRQDAG